MVRRLSLTPPNGKERGRLKDMLRVWKTLGATERDLLDLQELAVWTSNPGLRILRAEVDLGTGPGDLNLWCGKARQGKVQGQIQLLHMPANTEDGGGSHRQSPEEGTQRERGCKSVWCTFPCQQLRTSFGLPNTERLVKWGKEIDYEGWHNNQQVKAWVESWTTVVSVAPAILADLSCRLNVGAVTRLDGREKNSTVCIRFVHLRGQKPIQGKTASLEPQKGCLQLALEIQKICWPEARKFEISDLDIAFFTSMGGRTEDRILLRSRASTSQEMEEDTLVGILMTFILGNSPPRGPGVDLRW